MQRSAALYSTHNLRQLMTSPTARAGALISPERNVVNQIDRKKEADPQVAFLGPPARVYHVLELENWRLRL